MMWAVPDSKRLIKGIVIAAAVVLLVIYFHSEYLRWAELSGNTTYLSISYIIKNLIILISLIISLILFVLYVLIIEAISPGDIQASIPFFSKSKSISIYSFNG